jgi:alkylation response protein AidB-like acyl-CoA dehydrogenase
MEQKCGFQMPFADIAVVWAKNEEGRIHGLIVERGMEGFTTPETHNKWSSCIIDRRTNI